MKIQTTVILLSCLLLRVDAASLFSFSPLSSPQRSRENSVTEAPAPGPFENVMTGVSDADMIDLINDENGELINNLMSVVGKKGEAGQIEFADEGQYAVFNEFLVQRLVDLKIEKGTLIDKVAENTARIGQINIQILNMMQSEFKPEKRRQSVLDSLDPFHTSAKRIEAQKLQDKADLAALEAEKNALIVENDGLNNTVAKLMNQISRIESLLSHCNQNGCMRIHQEGKVADEGFMSKAWNVFNPRAARNQ